MLQDFNFEEVNNRYANFKRSELGEELDIEQRIVQRLNIPVLIFVDGWESSGKGEVINDLTRELNPQYVTVEVFDQRTDVEQLHPSIWRFWQKIPNNQEIVIFDQSFYSQVLKHDEKTSELLRQRTKELLDMERMLLDSGVIVIKFFLHVTQETQEETIKRLEESENRQYLISEQDYYQNEHYDEQFKWFSKVLNKTNIAESPWHVVSTEDRKLASKTVLGLTLKAIRAGVERVTLQRERKDLSPRNFHLNETQLDKFDVDKSLSDEEYHQQLETLQRKAAELVYECYTKKIAIIIAFEGVDAAGKGGAIKRLTRHIDPRSYKIYGTKAPTELEDSYHYMWRFHTRFPEDGNMVIFDRSWYGRVLVERVEGFTSESEWERAYEEINQTEQVLTEHGSIVMKFFLYIDEAEQKERFKSRVEEPDKNYKITQEDIRNRNKWDEYIDVMEEMLVRTDCPEAPWYIIASNDKYYARIEVLKNFIQHIEKHLDKFEREQDEG